MESSDIIKQWRSRVMAIMVNNSARRGALINIQYAATGTATQHSFIDLEVSWMATSNKFSEKQTTSHHTYNSALSSQGAMSVGQEAKQI